MTEREQFEAWARTCDGNCNDRDLERRPDGDYHNMLVQRDWDVWQASRRSALEEAAKTCDALSTDYNKRRRTSDNPTYMEGKSDGAEACASALYRAIRALSQKESGE